MVTAKRDIGKWVRLVETDRGVQFTIAGRTTAGATLTAALGEALPGYGGGSLAAAAAVLEELMRPSSDRRSRRVEG